MSCGDVEQAEGHTRIDSPRQVGWRGGGEPPIRDDLRQRQTARRQRVEQPLVERTVHRARHNAKVRLKGERGARAGHAKLEVISRGEPAFEAAEWLR